MYWLYLHLPEEVGVINFNRDNVSRVVNSKDCPKYKDRPCQKDGRCCLGCDQTCTHNTCQNSKVRAALRGLV